MGWKVEANKMFFNDGMKIVRIAEVLDKNRKTISAFLSTQKGFEIEKERRKRENRVKRKEYKRNWERNRKNKDAHLEAAFLKRQHEIDVRVLSAEKY